MKTLLARMLRMHAVAAFIASIALSAGSAAFAAPSAASTPDVPALLRAADRFRSDAEHLQVQTRVTVVKADGSLDKERLYTVLLQGDRRSLVLMRSPAEAGQKVLMLGEDFWLLMPASQRPIRITPTQKLLGDAATGDIATLSWAGDYQGRVVGEERCEGSEGSAAAGKGEGPGRPCLHLSLEGARKGLSYSRVELWLGAVRHEPIRAELYVQSDKLAKNARFVYESAPGAAGVPAMVSEMVLTDRLGSNKETRVRYLARQPRTVPEAWFNPMFLARNPALD